MSNSIKYDLHLLGWQNFQQLCNIILREILGQNVQSFLDSKDAGRDGAFTGEWRKTSGENLSGKFVLQCKHFSKPDKNLSVSDLKDEFNKARGLVARNLCDCYILMTNAGVSATSQERIVSAYKDCGIKEVEVLGYTWLCDQIAVHKKIRTAMPRLYGLGDLSEILDERSYSQAIQILTSIKDELAKLVLTNSYRKAASALDKYGFVLLVGDPASGKTTVATQLILAALDSWGALMMKLDTAEEVKDRWNPNNASQLFWIDDAFGATQYEARRATNWNYVFPQVKAMIKTGGKIIMTSRNYIYERARADIKESAFPIIQEAQVVVDILDLSIEEKRQILYNHLKLGNQSKLFLKQIKPYLEFIAQHHRFSPEMARRLAEPHFTKKFTFNEEFLSDFINRQKSFLLEVMRGLNKDDQSCLALVYMRNDRLESPINPKTIELQALSRLGSDLNGCIIALNALKGSFVQLEQEGNVSFWKFKHPTISDAFSEILIENTELLEIYLHGTAPDKIMQRVTCGNLSLTGAIIIPPTYYNLMLEKLDTYWISAGTGYGTWKARLNKSEFLATRCSKDFIELYMHRHNTLLEDNVKPGLIRNNSPSLKLVLRIKEFGLLQEKYRMKTAQILADNAINGDDVFALDNTNAEKLFTPEEHNEIKERIIKELVPNLEQLTERRIENYEGNEHPEDYVESIRETLRTLKKSYNSADIIQTIEVQEDRISEWVRENDYDPPEFQSRQITNTDIPQEFNMSRSIFEDIDE